MYFIEDFSNSKTIFESVPLWLTFCNHKWSCTAYTKNYREKRELVPYPEKYGEPGRSNNLPAYTNVWFEL